MTAVLTVMSVVRAYTAQAVVTRTGFRLVGVAGMVLVGAACLLLTQVSVDGSYFEDIFLGLLVLDRPRRRLRRVANRRARRHRRRGSPGSPPASSTAHSTSAVRSGSRSSPPLPCPAPTTRRAAPVARQTCPRSPRASSRRSPLPLALRRSALCWRRFCSDLEGWSKTPWSAQSGWTGSSTSRHRREGRRDMTTERFLNAYHNASTAPSPDVPADLGSSCWRPTRSLPMRRSSLGSSLGLIKERPCS